jgi:hypothetical protein
LVWGLQWCWVIQFFPPSISHPVLAYSFTHLCVLFSQSERSLPAFIVLLTPTHLNV